jgi:hypothetical protein
VVVTHVIRLDFDANARDQCAHRLAIASVSAGSVSRRWVTPRE